MTGANCCRDEKLDAGTSPRPPGSAPRNPAMASRSPAPRIWPGVQRRPRLRAAGVFTRNQVKGGPVLWSQPGADHRRLRGAAEPAAPMPAPGRWVFRTTRPPKPSPQPLSELGHRDRSDRGAVCSARADRRPAADGSGIAGITEIVHELGGGLPGRRGGRPPIMTTDTVPKQVALHHSDRARSGELDGRRDGQGRGMLAPLAGHHAGRAHHRCGGRCPRPGHRVAPRGGAHVRPPRRRRQLLHQRHRAAAGVRRQRDPPHPGRSRQTPVLAVCDDLCASYGPTPRADRGHRSPARQARTTQSPQPASSPDSLVKTALFGSRPELGPGARRSGHGAVHRRPIGSPCRSTARRCASTGPERRVPGTSTCPHRHRRHRRPERGPRRATIRTTDLSHAYVEENSAYSSRPPPRTRTPRPRCWPKRCRG